MQALITDLIRENTIWPENELSNYATRLTILKLSFNLVHRLYIYSSRYHIAQ